MKDENCIFCKIINKEIGSKILYEDNYSLAFLDIFPISKGHTIVIPKNHYKNIEDIPEKELIEVIITVKKIANKLHNKLNLEGYNILQNNFKAAGQVVEHCHFHIIPRTINDSRFRLKIPRERANDEELNDIINKIKS
jgi:histidine triad (HIT) family protein